MSATVFLSEPIDEHDHTIECTEVRVIGDLVWATPAGHTEEIVVPLSNVVGVSGDDVEQEIETIEAPGGRFTELVTDIS